MEIAVPLSDGTERVRGFQANDRIGAVAEFADGVGRRHGDGHNHFMGPVNFECFQGCAHGGTRGEAVVHKNDGGIAHIRPRAIAPVGLLTSLELLAFALGHFLDRLITDATVADHLAVENAGAATGDGAHGEFLLAGHSQFPDNHQVQLCIQMPGDFSGHGNAAAGQCQHYKVFTVTIIVKRTGQFAAGEYAVLYGQFHHATPLPVTEFIRCA